MDLPPEIMEDIFSRLDYRSLKQVSIVNSRWYEMSKREIVEKVTAFANPNIMQKFPLRDYKRVRLQGVRTERNSRVEPLYDYFDPEAGHVEQLTLYECTTTLSDFLRTMDKCRTVRSLKLEVFRVGDAADEDQFQQEITHIRHLELEKTEYLWPRFKGLETINIDVPCGLDWKRIVSVAEGNRRTLKKLILKNCGESEQLDWTFLCRLDALEHFDISGVNHFKEQKGETFNPSGLRNLQELHLTSSIKFKSFSETFAKTDLSNLKSFSLCFTNWTNEEILSAVKGMKRLRSFTLLCNMFYIDFEVIFKPSLPCLEELSVEGRVCTNVLHEAFELLAKNAPRLRKLKMRNCTVEVKSLMAMGSNLPNLEHLELKRMCVLAVKSQLDADDNQKDVEVFEFPNLRSFRGLNPEFHYWLKAPKLTHVTLSPYILTRKMAMQFVKDFPHIEELHVESTQINNDLVNIFVSGLPNLREINFKGEYNVTTEAVEAILTNMDKRLRLAELSMYKWMLDNFEDGYEILKEIGSRFDPPYYVQDNTWPFAVMSNGPGLVRINLFLGGNCWR